ncbi:MAG TPA: hypothetical protein VKN76_05570 [Kiloniellaceae bacterium]|nr:hypothetical protein [Kiloniellaceae bacterium]
MQIEWWTLAIQAVNFLVLLWLLRRFLYRPVRAVIEKRRAESDAAFAQAAAKEAEVEELKQQLEAERSAVAEERQAMLKKLHQEAAAEHDKSLERARDEARTLTEAARTAIEKERQAALHDLQGQTAQLAVELAARLLGQMEADLPPDAYLTKLEMQLKSLSSVELDELKADLAGQGGAPVVVTAQPLPVDTQDRWRRRLAAIVGPADATAFETDPALVGGAEIRFPHSRFKFTWADRLETARKALLGDEATP